MLPVVQLDKPPSPKPRRNYARLSLRSFLVLMTVVPLIIGLYVRSEMSRVKGYYIAESEIRGDNKKLLINSHAIYAAWRVDGLGRETHSYLIVQPPGDRGYSGGGPGFYPTPLVRSGPVFDDIAVEPDYLFFNGGRLSNDRYPTAWLYLTSSQLKETSAGVFERTPVQMQLLEIPLTELKISRADFARLAETELWKKHLGPAAQAEGERWWRLHLKASGLEE